MSVWSYICDSAGATYHLEFDSSGDCQIEDTPISAGDGISSGTAFLSTTILFIQQKVLAFVCKAVNVEEKLHHLFAYE